MSVGGWQSKLWYISWVIVIEKQRQTLGKHWNRETLGLSSFALILAIYLFFDSLISEVHLSDWISKVSLLLAMGLCDTRQWIKSLF